MNIAILTNTSENIKELTRVTLYNKSLYAEHHGYKMLCCDMNYANYNNEVLSVMKSNLDLMRSFDVVMTMGADTMFMNRNIKIENVLLSDDNILIAKERSSWWPINDDVMIYKCTPEVIAFYQRLIDEFDVWKMYPWRIQTHIWNLMQEDSSVKNIIRIVDSSVMNQHPNHWQLGDWIIHFYGMEVSDKIKLAQTYFNKWPDGNPVLKELHDDIRPGVL